MKKDILKIIEASEKFLASEITALNLLDRIDSIYTVNLYGHVDRNKMEEELYFLVQEYFDVANKCVQNSERKGQKIIVHINEQKLRNVVEIYTAKLREFIRINSAHIS
ncbi:MAG TPA: hypothetical protein DDX47_01645 [Candidatus Jacksonbacteria bacterium]|nr:MAG: hypothetical protein A2240_01335 [Candidatus Jacksonbacteria bacterium RIFOXYA2_FULL_43_12]OGY81830.1 MAG: hypothetical protein A2550_03620 [Candidatus Jacksonbacteria bacterium RIFOXYD2_FULL_43_21]HBH46051.1 hypothetical protein [Candidatus Jacksonbacteria bacterium]